MSIRDDGEDLVAAMTDALVQRAGYRLPDAHPAALDFRQTSIAEMQRILLRRGGVHAHDWNPDRLVTSIMRRDIGVGQNTSNFTDLLANVLTKTIELSLGEFTGSWQDWVPTVPYRHSTKPGISP